MASSSTASLIQLYPIITSKNFSNWKYRMTAILEEKGVLDAIKVSDEAIAKFSVDENRNFLQKDVLARNLILQSITDQHIECVIEAQTSHQMMKNLTKKFEQGSKSRRFILMEKLFSIQYTKNEGLRKFFKELDSIFTELEALGGKMDEQDKIYCLLVKLKNCYESEVAAIDATKDGRLGMMMVKNKLLSAETKLKSRETSVNNPVPKLKNIEGKLLKQRTFYIRCREKCCTCDLVTTKQVRARNRESQTVVRCQDRYTVSMLRCRATGCKSFYIDRTSGPLNRRINDFRKNKLVVSPRLFDHARTHDLEFDKCFSLIVLKRVTSKEQLLKEHKWYTKQFNAYEHPGLNVRTKRNRGRGNTSAASSESVQQPSGSDFDSDGNDDQVLYDEDTNSVSDS